MKRDDRKTTAKMLAAKGLSTREIAALTGWTKSTIDRDLTVPNGTKTVPNGTPSTTDNEPTKTARAARDERAAEIAAAAAAKGATPEPSFDDDSENKYRIVYADPPWSYSATMPAGEAYEHYPVMELTAICALPVKDWVEPNAVLFLWATSPILEEAFQVVKAWGFEYKASFVWDKIKHNMGHYNSVRHELLLVCTHGSCQPDKQQLFESVQSIERGKHSEKPVKFYDIIETLYTHGRKLEIFARDTREGWDVYGHVAEMEAAE
jgi:N6-adenosine-specific RNA methylase IME4